MPPERKKELLKFCMYVRCGAKLERKRYNGRLESFSVFLRRKHCSPQCAALQLSLRAENPSVRAARQFAARRCSGIKNCQRCGVNGEQRLLETHHVDGDPMNNPVDGSNWRKLCVPCHRLEDSARRRLTGESGNVTDESF